MVPGEAGATFIRADTSERSPAMADVAKLAGVSQMTVSRVLHNHPNVRPATKARVVAAIDQLGYRPNLTARSLASGRSTQLGVITLNSMLLGPVATLYAVEQAAQSDGYSLSVTTVRSVDRRSLSESVSRLVQQSVAGLIVIAPVGGADLALGAIPPELPAVLVDAGAEPGVSAVAVDQRLGASLATQHLLDLGHRTVFHVSGPQEWLDAQQRVAGWLGALEAAGAPVPEVISGDWSAQAGYDAGQVLAHVPEATAVFVGNDNMALGLLRALNELGRTVPGDLSVVGFDDIAEAGFFTPPLTSVRQGFSEMGRRSVELLIRQVESGSRTIEHVTLEPALVIRNSTAAPR
jgi:DNA-binding LacI/PurR family transcriptional regulator